VKIDGARESSTTQFAIDIVEESIISYNKLRISGRVFEKKCTRCVFF